MNRYNWTHVSRVRDGKEEVLKLPAIVTVHVFPPIPQRFYDYCAYRDGYEPGCPCGWGSTEEIAIADLLELEEDADHYARWVEEEYARSAEYQARRDDAREGFES